MSRAPTPPSSIRLHGCCQHNLANLDLEIPLGQLTVVTGPSGSGKSSLAFHTLYAEGQRRYVETFSPYVRQFFDRVDKPQVDSIEGIPPAIAIEQKNHVRTTRSTVGTLTEINDYLKLLFPRMADAFEPTTGELIRPDTAESATEWAMANLAGRPVVVTFPLEAIENPTAERMFPLLRQQGYLRVWWNGEILRTDETGAISGDVPMVGLRAVQDRMKLVAGNSRRLMEALEVALRLGKGEAAVHDLESGRMQAFSSSWTHPATGFRLRPPTPALFSFNSPVGACPKCRGFGRVIGVDLEKTVPDPSLSIVGGAVKPFQGERGEECQRDLLRCCKVRGIDTRTPWEDLSAAEREWIYYGDRKTAEISPEELEALWNDGDWYGVKGFFDWLETKSYKMHVRVFLSRYRSYTTCAACRGRRLQPEALCFRIDGKSLPDLWQMPVSELCAFMKRLEAGNQRGNDPTRHLILSEIITRLSYLGEVGLGYLTLDRPTRTLSGGEIERVNLTACLGASLTGALFVLDEPTVGLHARDIEQLVGVMRRLRDKGNTLVVVEHEREVMQAADHLIDLGPGAGSHGGKLMYAGAADRAHLAKHGGKHSQGTLPWLTGRKSIPLPTTRRKSGKQVLSIRGASRHNLRKLDADIPLGMLVCVTGVSGSGKSTLAHDVIYQNLAIKLGQPLDDGDPAPIKRLDGFQSLAGVDLVDQSSVARTPRSTPALWTGAFEVIRQLFCETPAAKSAKLKPGYFSFNSGDGRCDRCSGIGFEKVEMQFLSDLYVVCPDCDGRRYKPSALEYRWMDQSIAEVLDLTAEQALALVDSSRECSGKERRMMDELARCLRPLIDVGLGYLKLGQPLNTLSGGESQRLKLCKLLQDAPAGGGRRLLIMDEPTTGLHFADIERLLGVFQKLVDDGHSLLVIEHNLEVIKCADWILDIGPEAGEGGGRLVGQGPPEVIAKLDSPTARFIRMALDGDLQPSVRKPAARVAASGAISLRGARHHNLKNVSLDIPRDQLVVVSGLSGSGKSTLAFDILFAEGQRRFLDSMSTYARQFAEQLEKPEIDQLQGLPPTVAIEQRVSQGGGKSTVATVTELWNFIRLLYAKLGTLHCPDCQVPVEKQSLAAIENSILGHLRQGSVKLLAPLVRGKKGYHTEIAAWASRHGFAWLQVDGAMVRSEPFERLERFKEHHIDVVVGELAKGAAKGLPELIARALEIGKGVIKVHAARGRESLLSVHAACPSCSRSFEDLDPRLFSFNSPHGWCPECRGHGRVPRRRRQLDIARFDSWLEAELDADRAIERMEDDELVECSSCHGARIQPVGAAVRVQEVPIAALARLSIDAAADHFSRLSFAQSRDVLVARDILPEIRQRLAFLQQVGLGYLQLDRSGNTLSGGESQRIRLAAQLGSNLRGVLYVLDEPTIGLHPRDNKALLDTLVSLRDHGNSLVIVEHDEDTIRAADHLIDLGPGAGRLGGEVVYQGGVPVHGGRETKAARRKMLESGSPTLRALVQPMQHPLRGARREVGKRHPRLEVVGCSANNLRDVGISVPLGRLTVLTGVSGSGKSTLMHRCIAAAAVQSLARKKSPGSKDFLSASGFDAIKACYEVDQSPIGKTSRSCPATYVKVFDHIRALFAQLPEARIRGFDASRFSFNTDGGRCPECKGNGRVRLEMDFLPATWVHCECCNGDRYNPSTLEVVYKGNHIGKVLAMTIDEAAVFFEAHPRIAAPLKLLADTGLGYLQLGQPSPTLSGGEAQRIKLVAELIRGRSDKEALRRDSLAKRNLYLIEEPTVGLHHEDIRRLIDVLHRLVDEGHTVMVIEHHMSVAAEADWILDIGPEAGAAGGLVVAEGTPEKVAASKRSRTAPFLKLALESN